MFGIRSSKGKQRLAAALALVAALVAVSVTASSWWPLSPAEKLIVGKWKGVKTGSSTHTFVANRSYLCSDGTKGRWSVASDGLLHVRFWINNRPSLIPPRFRGSDKFLFKFRFDGSFDRVELDCVTDQTNAVLTRVSQK